MRILYDNKVDSTLTTLQADSEYSTDYPIEQVQDQRLTTKWKSSDGSTQSIIIDLGKRTAIDSVAILGHNFNLAIVTGKP